MLLEVRGLRYALSGKLILDEVSFSLEEGGYLSIVGPNGAGKTTLLKIIAGILAAESGEVRIAGSASAELSATARASLIGYVPQSFDPAYPHTAAEFVLMGLYPGLGRLSRIGSREEAAVRESLETVGASSYADRELSSLSGGERQKVLLAAALVHKPKLLLLDEPTTFLDPKHEEETELLLARVRKQMGIGILAVTHNLNLCALHSTHIVGLRAGRVVFSGGPEKFMQSDVLEDLFGQRFELVFHPGRAISMILPRLP